MAISGYSGAVDLPLPDHGQMWTMWSLWWAKFETGTDVFYHQGSGTASQATPRGRHRIRAEVGFELAI